MKKEVKSPFIKSSCLSMLGGVVLMFLLSLVGLVLIILELPGIFKVELAIVSLLGFITGVYWSCFLYAKERGEDFNL